MEATAPEFFASLARDYDSLIRRAVPRYEEILARVVEHLPDATGPDETGPGATGPDDPGKPTRILELGCGTGNLTEALGRRYRTAELTLVDGAREMLDAARSRLESSATVTTIQSRFEDLALPAGSFDIATACISLHHVQDKRALFRSLHHVLASGAALVFADQMRGQTARHHALNWDRMRSFWRRPENLDAAEIHSLEEHARLHDHYVSIGDHYDLLREAGFRDVDCVWRNWMWGIMTATA